VTARTTQISAKPITVHKEQFVSQYHNDEGKNDINADEVKIKPKSRNKPGKVIEGMGKDLG